MNRALRAATVGVLLLSPVVLSACSAGQVAQTAIQLRDKTGGRAQVGQLSLREVALAFPDGGSYAAGDAAELRLAIVNDGAQDDTLTGISGQGFSGAVFTAKSAATASSTATASSSAATSSAPTGAPVASSGAPVSGTPSATALPSTSAAPSTSTATPVPTELPIPAGQTVFVGTGTTHITLTGLQSALTTGQFVTLTLSFQKAGDVTLRATVANPTSPLTRSDTYNFNQTGG